MRVLVACEWSNTVRDAFIARGHDAYSCDLVRAEYPNRNWKRHIRGDVRPLLLEPWDLVIAHPPCTYLCNSGIRWMTEREGRLQLMFEAVDFFKECLAANAPRVCVENPVHHIYAKMALWVEPTQVIQPYQFGDAAQKTTCLWLKGLPPLKTTNLVSKGEFVIHGGRRLPKWYSNREVDRSRTFPGIARAMAEQWGTEHADAARGTGG